jgi:alkylhydroperoxidase/carboxymuconolactone decarboxylase family protein YurZ
MSVLRQSDHPARQGQARAGPAGARETGQQRARAVTTISPRSPLSHASKPINSPSRISKGINTIQSWGKQEHEELLSNRLWHNTNTSRSERMAVPHPVAALAAVAAAAAAQTDSCSRTHLPDPAERPAGCSRGRRFPPEYLQRGRGNMKAISASVLDRCKLSVRD